MMILHRSIYSLWWERARPPARSPSHQAGRQSQAELQASGWRSRRGTAAAAASGRGAPMAAARGVAPARAPAPRTGPPPARQRRPTHLARAARRVDRRRARRRGATTAPLAARSARDRVGPRVARGAARPRCAWQRGAPAAPRAPWPCA
eukprot:scaffold13340_cov71-Phaeocystis_antarctica.AAC.3